MLTTPGSTRIGTRRLSGINIRAPGRTCFKNETFNAHLIDYYYRLNSVYELDTSFVQPALFPQVLTADTFSPPRGLRQAIKSRLNTFVSSDNHGQNTGLFPLLGHALAFG